MKEHLLTIDRYNKPAVVSDNDAINVLICTLLLLEPGSDPLHPEKGVGIRSRFRMSTEDNLDSLEDEIKEQILTYIPGYNPVDCEVSTYNGDFRISIKLDDTLFNINGSELINGNDLFPGDDNSDIPDEEGEFGIDDGDTEWEDENNYEEIKIIGE